MCEMSPPGTTIRFWCALRTEGAAEALLSGDCCDVKEDLKLKDFFFAFESLESCC